MEQSFEQAGRIGQEFVDASLRGFATLSNNLQVIGAEAAEYSRASFESGAKAIEQMVGAKSPEKAMEIQAGYARSAYEEFVARSTRMGELYADLARDIYKPFESVVARNS
jgi:hypothetical protein